MFPANPATQIAWKIRDIQHRHMTHIHGILESFGLHAGQPRILHVVLHMNGATQREIAEKLKISPASLAVSVKRMQKVGLLKKVADASDLRVTKIQLTPKGQKTQEESLKKIIEWDEQMLSGFSTEEIDRLSEYLERIYKNLDSAEETEHDT